MVSTPTFPTTEKEETEKCVFFQFQSLLNAQRQKRRKQPIFLIIHVTMFALFIPSFFSIIYSETCYFSSSNLHHAHPSAVLYHLCKVVSHCNDQTNDLLPTFGADKTNTGRDAHDGVVGGVIYQNAPNNVPPSSLNFHLTHTHITRNTTLVPFLKIYTYK